MCRIFMELQEEHPFYLCKKSPNSCIGGNFLPALTILVTLLQSTIVGHKSLDQALFKNNYAIKKPVCDRAGIITQSFTIHQAVISKNNDNFVFSCTRKIHRKLRTDNCAYPCKCMKIRVAQCSAFVVYKSGHHQYEKSFRQRRAHEWSTRGVGFYP